MLTRREFLQVAAATTALGLTARPQSILAEGRVTQEDLLAFEPLGQVTLLNFTDIHAQLMPLYYREPDTNLGIGDDRGKPPHLTGKALLQHFGLPEGGVEAYAFTDLDFVRLAREYGRVGGVAHLATLIGAIRAERPGRTLLIDNGDTWQGSYTSLETRGADMVRVMNALGVDAMTAHWEFTYGAKRVKELIGQLKFPFLAGNVRDTEWEEPVFESTARFERGGLQIAVIGQAFPYTPVANPRHLIPNWAFGIRQTEIQAAVDAARDGGADLVVLASHDGFDVDHKLAGVVRGIDVILTGHTHDAIPAVIRVGDTLLVAAGSHGKFLARLDLDVAGRRIRDFRFRLIPVLSDAITPDPAIAALVKDIRAPYQETLDTVLGRADSLLYRRGNFNGSFDDLICQAIRAERDTEIALSPGFRWGGALLPGQDIRVEDVYNQTAITYPNCYRMEMTGARIRTILEDVADNLFNMDPFYRQGGDMVRVGGLGYGIDVARPMGKRIRDLVLWPKNEPIDPDRNYTVGGWASVNPGVEGPPVYEVVSDYLRRHPEVRLEDQRAVRVLGS
uniref:Sulfate thiol esterase SoxB n=1 Tax=Candidatus Kentrum sp. SD TaxID=2126332 RepID=A0A451BQ52_9GAMM|nr:MAG: sulfate thiol esterase SoxB [Candidatus Kentron sp. SD]VFK49654.1 MAG: sulfate thiol esterase SoxB [Candidatus Kentron sp. SD]VFK80375.1 MAG: sulfate thiol esterase SoxB [Candidatus Kentron sp. SD]